MSTIDTFNTILKANNYGLNASIDAAGYTRGAAHRGKVVINTPDGAIVVAFDDGRYRTIAEYATVAEAEAHINLPHSGDEAFRAAAQAVQERIDMDGPTGYGQ